MDKGVLILALGDEMYGRYAYNLAMSIKASNENILVALAVGSNSTSSLSKKQLALFDKIVNLEAYNFYINGVFSPLYAKLNLIEYTPFKKTMFIDADSLAFKGKDLSQLFDLLDDTPLQTTILKSIDLDSLTEKSPKEQIHVWGDVYEAKKKLKLSGTMYTMSTTFIYAENKYPGHILRHAAQLYRAVANKELKLSSLMYKDQICDEPILAYTAAKFKYKPKFEYFYPFRNANKHTFPISKEVEEHVYGITIPGDATNDAERLYNGIVSQISHAFGNDKPFYWQNKKW